MLHVSQWTHGGQTWIRTLRAARCRSGTLKMAKKAAVVAACFFTVLLLLARRPDRDHVTYSEQEFSAADDERQPKFHHLNRSFSSLTNAAFAVMERNPMLITFINSGYIPLTNNWLCHTKHFPGLHQNMLILAQDEDTRTRLAEQWPGLMVTVMAPARSNVSLHGVFKFDTVGYIRVMVRRTELINQLLQASQLGGVITSAKGAMYLSPSVCHLSV